MPELRIRPRAELETFEIFDWYEERTTGLGKRFLSRLEECYEELKRNPFRNAVVFGDFRIGFVTKFPYIVYYRVIDGNVVIFRVIHTSRDHLSLLQSGEL